MLTRLAACFMSLGLLAGTASAHGFAQPPSGAVIDVAIDEARLTMPVQAVPDRVEVRKALEKRRAKNLAAFRAYRKAGVYPHNTVRPGPLNVWRDAENHLCAAATMIWADGKHDLVDDTAKDDNQIRLMNVTEGALLDWILTSGFTVEEIDMIQAPMVYPDGRVDGPFVARDFTAEDAKLKVGYVRTDAYLVKHGKRGVDTALDRLMRNPDLARKLVAGTV
jgi:hypothetical protein